MRTIRRASVAVGAAALLTLAGACHDNPNYPARWSADLAAARERWVAAGVANYTIGIHRTCFCVGGQIRPVRITVRGGAFSSIVYSDSTGGVADTALFRQYLTVDRYFALLSEVLASGPDGFTGQYSPTLGFPLFVSVDPSAQIADDEFNVLTLSFARDSL